MFKFKLPRQYRREEPSWDSQLSNSLDLCLNLFSAHFAFWLGQLIYLYTHMLKIGCDYFFFLYIGNNGPGNLLLDSFYFIFCIYWAVQVVMFSGVVCLQTSLLHNAAFSRLPWALSFLIRGSLYSGAEWTDTAGKDLPKLIYFHL